MNKLKSFLRTSLLGGLTVILPVAILVFVFIWIFDFVTELISPLTNALLAKSDLREIVANLIVISIIILFCFLVGVLVKTRIGRFLHKLVEQRFFRIAPGYNMVKETVLQLLGGQKNLFSTVALARIFGNDTMVTVFITDEHSDGSYTVFMPTGPNPTSGNIYHLERRFVHIIDVSVEEAMRSIISCGAGSTKLIAAYREKLKK